MGLLTYNVAYLEDWKIVCEVDEDRHLNVYVTNLQDDPMEIETGRGDGRGEQLALRFTTETYEKWAREDENAN